MVWSTISTASLPFPSCPPARCPGTHSTTATTIYWSSQRAPGPAGAASGTARATDGLGHRPAVVVIQFRQQTIHHVAAGQAGLLPGEAWRDPCQQVLEQPGVPFIIYRGTSGCRLIVLFYKLA